MVFFLGESVVIIFMWSHLWLLLCGIVGGYFYAEPGVVVYLFICRIYFGYFLCGIGGGYVNTESLVFIIMWNRF